MLWNQYNSTQNSLAYCILLGCGRELILWKHARLDFPDRYPSTEKIVSKNLTIFSNTEVFPLFLVLTVAASSSQIQIGKNSFECGIIMLLPYATVFPHFLLQWKDDGVRLFWWCSVTEQRQWAPTEIKEVPYEHQEPLFHCESTGTVCCGVSTHGDTEELPGNSPGPPALDGPA